MKGQELEESKDIKIKNLLNWVMFVGLWLGGTGLIYLIIWTKDIELFNSNRFLALMGYFVFGGLYCAWLYFENVRRDWSAQHFNCLSKLPKKIRDLLAYFTFVFPLLLFSLITYMEKPYTSWLGLSVIILCSSTASLLLTKDFAWQITAKYWAFILLIATLFFVIGKELNTISNYPFSMGWSETSRYYLASLIRDKEIYGINLPLPHRNLTRYLMQAVPFFISGADLWIHRFWESLMRVGLPFLTSFFFVRRLNLNNKWIRVFALLWGGLFLMQGPVFYPMLIILLIIFITFDSKRLRYSTIWIIIASIWAGLTRINWIPMPALIAIMLYIMENRIGFEKGFSKVTSYLSFPILWGVTGILSGLVSQEIYQINSGLPESIFSTDFSSDLLWYRLLPNVSYTPGILLGIFIVSVPLVLFIILTLLKNKKNWHLIRTITLLGILIILFLGGLLVSTKIGGGTNLHNMDVFLVTVYIFGSYLYFNRYENEIQTKYSLPSSNVLISAIIFLPVIFHGLDGYPATRKYTEVAEANLLEIEIVVNEYKDDGDVLFITERHLLTFEMIKNLDYVNEYEKMILMEMTMGRNMDYLNNFYDDLRAHRFSLILTGKIPNLIRNPNQDSLSEENNIFVELVSLPINCYYEPIDVTLEIDLLLWIPLEENTCP